MTTFSIIIPVYNASAYIEQSLTSVFAQTYCDFEVIVVDDGSTDDTVDRVKKFSHHASLRYVYQANAGPAAARNTGLQLASGELIAFLDVDDLWHPGKLQAHFERMQTSPKIGLSFNWFKVFHDRPDVEGLMPWFAPPTKSTLQWQDFLIRNWTGTSSTVVIRAECLQGGRCFDARFRTSEDYQLWLQIAQDGWEVSFIADALTMYRRRPNSLSVDYLQIALDELLVMKQGVRIDNPSAKVAINLAITRRQLDVAWAYFRSGQRQMAWQSLKQGYRAVPQFLIERLRRKWLHRPVTS